MKDNTVSLGTTTVGICCKDGLVIAADKRASAGSYIINQDEKKVVPINDKIVVTTAGNASDSQLLVKLIRSEIELKQIRVDKEVKVKEAANLLARMVFQNIRKPSMLPGVSHFILGGNDSNGNHLFDIFPDGTITPQSKYVASGSGSLTGAYGILDTEWKKDITMEAGIKLAARAINAAMQRDMFTGGGIDIYTVTNKGVKKVLYKEAKAKIEI